MQIYFGLSFDDLIYPIPQKNVGGIRYLGPQGLLYLLESHLGLSGHPNDIEYLRIEQYRQALASYLERRPDVFFAASFQADPFAAATELLGRRDELYLAGWDFSQAANIPERLSALAQVEALLNEEDNSGLSLGFAERFCQALIALETGRHPIKEIRFNEPLNLLPFHYQRLFDKLSETGVLIKSIASSDKSKKQTDLQNFKNRFYKPDASQNKKKLNADGSLLLIKGKRDNQLAHFLAKLIKQNENFQPLCIIPEKNRALDHALLQEGLPSLGILSASLSRPTIQVLKLAPVFLWNPIDPYKVMEFVSLAVKPLNNELANRLALRMSESPGLNSDGWYATVRQFFEELRAHSSKDARVDLTEIEYQYQFWFERKRYEMSSTAPKSEVFEIYQYLSRWARACFDEEGALNQSLLVLSEQANRICELLDALPEEQLTHLELEHIVRTIYEAAPIQLHPCEKGHLPHVFHPQSVFDSAPKILWWNFIQNEPAYFFARWYQSEQIYLEKRQIYLQTPKQQNELLVWQRKRPVLLAQDQLVLVLPEQVAGSEKSPSPLYGDLQAAFENPEAVTYNIDTEEGKEQLIRLFSLPLKKPVPSRQLGRPKAFVHINSEAPLRERENETVSSLESLFYYPYQWVFRHKIQLKKSAILSIVKDNTLMGNLAHRFFERLLKKEAVLEWDQAELDSWIDKESRYLLQREGAILLMYGREPERVNFIKRLKYAAWSLINLIRDNGWQIEATEAPLETSFVSTPVNGRVDLALKREGERAVVDLKWRGASRRERMIRNEEDLQLILYGRLIDTSGQWAHTAYFIMEQGKMIARNALAFKNASSVAPEADHLQINERIFERMAKTYRWRLEQIKKGQIEIRCQHTLEELEETYGSELLEVLEMKTENAFFDDYRTLINLIE